MMQLMDIIYEQHKHTCIKHGQCQLKVYFLGKILFGNEKLLNKTFFYRWIREQVNQFGISWVLFTPNFFRFWQHLPNIRFGRILVRKRFRSITCRLTDGRQRTQQDNLCSFWQNPTKN
jgi:hypothetical protein